MRDILAKRIRLTTFLTFYSFLLECSKDLVRNKNGFSRSSFDSGDRSSPAPDDLRRLGGFITEQKVMLIPC